LRTLVVNAGSSSLKLSVLDSVDKPAGSGSRWRTVAAGTVPAAGASLDEGPVRDFLAEHAPIDAVGHRVVHGGNEFTGPVLVDEGVVRRLEALTDLAPLHQPKSLRGLRLVRRLLPRAPAVACFDTAFHATVPPAARTYALPPQWRRRWDLRRYGFHGLSHAWASRRAAELMGRETAEELKVVTCHLGAGASLAAVESGKSVDTTMGFTPLEGLVMATRSGSVDPGLVLWLEEHIGMPPSELASTLEYRSGLLGLAGTPDMGEVLRREGEGDASAALAVGVYLHRLRGEMARMAAALGGLDALVFTGGVGEHSPAVRRRAAEGLGFLGVELDAAANEAAAADCEVGAAGAGVRTFVIEAREDLEIARGVCDVLGSQPAHP
jgi:acetate kinase